MTSERLASIQKELRGLRNDVDSRINSLHQEVVGHLKEHSNQLASLFKQHVELVERLSDENKELKDEVERLRRF